MKIAISSYLTGEEIWRGEVDAQTWEKYWAEADQTTGAARPTIFLDSGILTGHKLPETIFAEEI